MKKIKKKRTPNKKHNTDNDIEPIEIVILDEPDQLRFIFSFSNKSLKMLKAGSPLEKTFLKDGKRCSMMFMHRDVYDENYRKPIELRRRLIKEKLKQELAISKDDCDIQCDVE